jgi:hypothetical protein
MAKKELGSAGTVLSTGATGAKIGSMFGPIGTAVGGVVGGLAGLLFGGRKPTEQEKAYIEALQEMGRIPDIDWESTIPKLSPYEAQEIKDAILEGDRDKLTTAFENIPAEDPQLRSAKMEALGSLRQQGKEGFTLEDEVGLQQITGEQAAQARRSRDDVMRRMEQQGMGGSGAAMAAQLAAEQTGANRAAQEQLAIAAQRQQARRDALSRSGSLAQNFSVEDYGRETNLATARDVFSKFNEQQGADRARRNVEAQRGTEAERLAERRGVESSRVSTENQMAIARANMPKDQYAHQRSQVLDKASLRAGEAGAIDRSREEASKRVAGAAKGALDVATAYGPSIKNWMTQDTSPTKTDEEVNAELKKRGGTLMS